LSRDGWIYRQEGEGEVLGGPGGPKDIYISADWNGINTGVFMMRNSSWSKWFLEEAWGTKVSGKLERKVPSFYPRISEEIMAGIAWF
jgi:hypothetical protein